MLKGRPTKYRPEMCEEMQKHFNEGCSIEEVCHELGIYKDTFYNWKKKHPEFSDAVKKGLESSEAWWKKQGRVNMFGDKEKPFSATLWFMNMKNRFGWADKVEGKQDHTIKFEIDYDQ